MRTCSEMLSSADIVDDQERRLNDEIEHLLTDIRRIGPTHPAPSPHVLFGELFEDEIVEQYYEALVGTLKSAKKRGFVTFKGQILLKGMHDQVVISIVDSAKAKSKASSAAARPPDQQPLVTMDDSVTAAVVPSPRGVANPAAGKLAARCFAGSRGWNRPADSTAAKYRRAQSAPRAVNAAIPNGEPAKPRPTTPLWMTNLRERRNTLKPKPTADASTTTTTNTNTAANTTTTNINNTTTTTTTANNNNNTNITTTIEKATNGTKATTHRQRVVRILDEKPTEELTNNKTDQGNHEPPVLVPAIRLPTSLRSGKKNPSIVKINDSDKHDNMIAEISNSPKTTSFKNVTLGPGRLKSPSPTPLPPPDFSLQIARSPLARSGDESSSDNPNLPSAGEDPPIRDNTEPTDQQRRSRDSSPFRRNNRVAPLTTTAAAPPKRQTRRWQPPRDTVAVPSVLPEPDATLPTESISQLDNDVSFGLDSSVDYADARPGDDDDMRSLASTATAPAAGAWKKRWSSRQMQPSSTTAISKLTTETKRSHRSASPVPPPLPADSAPEPPVVSKPSAALNDCIEEEVSLLVMDICRIGLANEPRCTFGELFDDEDVQQRYEALVGTLRCAKRRGVVKFKGQMLLKGMHDHVEIEVVRSG